MKTVLDKSNVQEIFELNGSQSGMLYHYLNEPDNNSYNIQVSLNIKGVLDMEILSESLRIVQENNDVLRSVFRWENVSKPVQIILKKHTANLKFHDLVSRKEEKNANTYIENDRDIRFDLRELPFRFTVLKVAPDLYKVIITHHHIIYDGWSSAILLKELFTTYHQLTGKEKTDFKDKTDYKRILLAGRRKTQSEDSTLFWKDYLKNCEPHSVFTKREINKKEDKLERLVFNLPTIALDVITKEHKITKAAVLYAVYAILLHKYYYLKSVVFGTTLSNRDSDIQGNDRVMGNYVNTLPLRINISGDDRIIDIVNRIYKDLLNINQFSGTSYFEIKQLLGLDPNSDVFDSTIVIQNYPLDERITTLNKGFSVTLDSYYQKTSIPFGVYAFFREKCEMEFIYKVNQISEQEAQQLKKCFTLLFKNALKHPEKRVADIEMLSVADKKQLLAWFTNKLSYPKNKSIPDLFKAQVLKRSDQTAVVAEGKQLSYQELDKRSNQLARWLNTKEGGRDKIVALALDRSLDMIVGILGVLKSGGAYLPIALDLPVDRVSYMLEQSNAKILITHQHYLSKYSDYKIETEDICSSEITSQKHTRVSNPIRPDDLCYCIFTSGSTGLPKGVLMEHKGVINLVMGLKKEVYDHYPAEPLRIALLASYAFDASVQQIFASLLLGHTLYIVGENDRKEGIRITDFYEKNQIHLSDATPTHLNLVVGSLATPANLSHPKCWLVAGEILPKYLVQQVFKYVDTNDFKLFNLYGPTETCVDSTIYEIKPGQLDHYSSIPIGKALPNERIYIVDQYGNLLPDGCIGELCIAGDGLARGYLSDTMLTDKKFVSGLIPEENRVYRTGDLVRRLPDGNIEYLERMDNQVKLRGYRIELGEIEHLLKSHDQIKDAVVIIKGTEEKKSIVAYLIVQEELNLQAIRAYLSAKLPEYMVPSYFVRLKEIPLTINGKLDKSALPEPLFGNYQEYLAPSNETEEKLQLLWCTVLKLNTEQVSVNQSFFELGGNSLNLIQLTNRIRKEFNVNLALPKIVELQNILNLSIEIQNTSKSAYSRINKAVPQEYYPLSSAQQRLYFLHELEPLSLAYNMPYAARLKGKIDKERLQDTFGKMIERHEILRTSFMLVNNEPCTKIDLTNEFKIEEYASEGNETELIRKFTRPFDLKNSPLLRVGLIRNSTEDHFLLIDIHHIINDGVSQEVFIRDFISIYQGEVLPELRLQYKDFAVWQQRVEQQEVIKKQKDFWLNEFAEPAPILELPVDFSRPVVKKNTGRTIDFELSHEETQALKGLAESENATLFMTLLSVYYVFLSKLSNQEDIVIGTPVAGRQHEDVEKLLGLFLNSLPLRNYPEGNLTFRSFLSSVKTKALACFEHQAFPYESLIDNLKIQRDMSRNPLFDALFLFQNQETIPFSIPGNTVEPYNFDRNVAKLDLTLEVTKINPQLCLNFEYSTELFEENTIKKFIDNFKKVVSIILENKDIKISEIDILSEDERNRQLFSLNDTYLPYDKEATIVSRFKARLRVNPDAIALSYEGTALTYSELDQQSTQLALVLQKEYGIGSNKLVSIMVDRSEKLVVSILGVLKAGGAYVPIDPIYPEDRITYILQDSKSNVLLVSSILNKNITYEGALVNVNEVLNKDVAGEESLTYPVATDLCYLIYTSGSTGKPKGVMITHGNVVNFFEGMSQTISIDEKDCILAVTNTSFDISVLELLWTLCKGVQVIIHPSDVSLNNLDRYIAPVDNTKMDFGLFFFSSYQTEKDQHYKLLLDSVQYADQEGFKAVWTPERHFHDFGGLYPNPSVISSALAVLTKKIEIRSGSIVSPLHDVIRIAEDWSIVDNLSKGRVGLSFASGWNPDDFILANDKYAHRQKTMFDQIEELKQLWRGKSIKRINGKGQEVNVHVYPTPVQKELPIWITSAGNAETFKSAGTIGANILTHFLGQDLNMLSENINVYRTARKQAGNTPGKVVLMIHTYIGTDINEVEATVEQPFIDYLKSSIGLGKVIFEEAGFKEEDLTEELKNKILKGSFKRYYQNASLIGTKASCARMIKQLKEIGVDELACLIDFGVAHDKVIKSLHNLNDLQKQFSSTAEGKVQKAPTLMQSTPSFIKLLKEDAGSAKFLNALRLLLIGGEAVSPSLVQKIKSDNDNVDIFNMYGPTETTIWSSTYNFRSLEKVTIGKPIANTQMYVLNKDLKLLPLGATGDLYIGGDGLSKGYWNKPELTAERFIINPFNTNERIYNTGDLAKWLPDGNLEYIGRKDHQVKINGFRIELQEIEKSILDDPSIKAAVVVSQDDQESNKKLVGYVISDNVIDFSELRARLSKKLPFYMLPSYFMQLEKFPLSLNGKLDRKLLPFIHPQVNDQYLAPKTIGEKLLVEVWTKVLGVNNIGVNDNFFSVGGDSIKSIQIVSRMRTAGYELSVKDVFTTQNIKELALRLHATTRVADQRTITGKAHLTPIQRWLFESNTIEKHHYNQAVMLKFAGGIAAGTVNSIFEKIQQHHDALRMVFKEENDEIISETLDLKHPLSISDFNLQNNDRAEETILELSNQIQSGIDLINGPLMKLGLFHLPGESRLLIVIHHLVVDGVSWRILFEDIENLYLQIQENKPLSLPLKTDSFKSWSDHLATYTTTKSFKEAQQYWNDVEAKDCHFITRDYPEGKHLTATSLTESFSLSAQQTIQLLTEVNVAFGTQINDILLSALFLSIKKHYGNISYAMDMESHGREELMKDVDISRTIGWFTNIYKVVFNSEEHTLEGVIKFVKETLRQIPNNGFDYLLKKYIDTPKRKNKKDTTNNARIFFNYLGQFDADANDKSYTINIDGVGDVISRKEQLEYDWNFLGMITEGQLKINITYSGEQYNPDSIVLFIDTFKYNLIEIIDYCSAIQKVRLTPSDVTYKKISITELDQLQEKFELENVYPLSSMQEGFLVHSLLKVNSDDYFFQIISTISGTYDIQLMKSSMHDLTARHDILRTIFINEGLDRSLQIVLKEKPIDFNYLDLTHLEDPREKAEAIESYRKSDKARKLNLNNDPLLRLAVIQTEIKEYHLIWSYHHILIDGWCLGILLDEFRKIYSAHKKQEKIMLPPVVPYSNYIKWIEERDEKSSIDYWKQYLSNFDSLSSLPKKFDYEENRYEQQYSQLILNQEQTKLLHATGSEYGITMYTIIQCAWAIVLSKYNNTNDIVFGSVVSGRPSEIQGIEAMVGLFINTVPVRVKYNDDDSVLSVLKNIQKNALESDLHSYFSLADIQSLSELKRNLFDHILVFENFPTVETNESEAGGDYFQINRMQVFEQINYDFSITVIPGESTQIKFHFNAHKLDADLVNRIGGQLQEVLSNFNSIIHSRIGDIDILLKEEKLQLLQKFNNGIASYPKNKTIIDFFEEQVSSGPDNIAVVFGELRLTYKELNEKANRLAHHLKISYELKDADLVGIMIDRSCWFLISILGVLKAGGAYIPIDKDYPASRKSFMIEDAKPKLLIIESNNLFDAANYNVKLFSIDIEFDQLVNDERVSHNMVRTVDANNLAYIIYTSGSTGKPKGVMIEHRCIVNTILPQITKLSLDSEDNCLYFASVSFDSSVWEIFTSLACGSTLYIIEDKLKYDVDYFVKYAAKNKISFVTLPPAFFNLLPVEELTSIKTLITAGELAVIEKSKKFAKKAKFINGYGPTECCVCATLFDEPIDAMEKAIPIGRPISNAHIYILDRQGRMMPMGAAGELCVSGTGLARGYLNNTVLTNEKFVNNPFVSGERIYKTGDLARWLPDGNVEFLGRLDEQVKIRGFRVELGEIAAVLALHDEIKEVAVITRNQRDGDKILVAYYVPKTILDATAVRLYLSEKLPDYMIPSYYVSLEMLPMTINGKLDKNSLPDLDETDLIDYVAPSTETEERLQSIWADILKLDKNKINVNKSFFELGGHSLRASLLGTKVSKEFNQSIPLDVIFSLQTIQKLSEYLENEKWVKEKSLSEINLPEGLIILD